MNPTVLILPRARRELAALAQPEFERARDAIRALGENPGCRKLSGGEGWRIRIGDYRVIFGIDDRAREVLVLHFGNRRDVYR